MTARIAMIEVSSLACLNLNLDLDTWSALLESVPVFGRRDGRLSRQPSYLASLRDLWLCVPTSRRVCLGQLKLQASHRASANRPLEIWTPFSAFARCPGGEPAGCRARTSDRCARSILARSEGSNAVRGRRITGAGGARSWSRRSDSCAPPSR